jgi:Zn-dependent protease
MRPSLRLGRIAGVPIGLHYSWLIIAALITVSLAAHFRLTSPDWSPALVWACGVITALLFFATLTAHELAHALVARARGVPVRSITLFALGGVAQLEKEADSAATEFLIAIAGPIASVAIGVGGMGAAGAMGWTPEGGSPGPMAAILGWLGSINVMLAIFNLIPGYPLDGGRVLRATLWGLWGDADRATRSAARIGQVVAIVFIAAGLLQFARGAGIGGLWLAFIGWFLLEAARSSRTEAAISQMLRGIRAADVMTRDCEVVHPAVNLEGFVSLLVHSGRRCFMVGHGDDIVGLITPHDVRAIDRSAWPTVRVQDAMRPLASLSTVDPETPVTDALRIMSRDDVNQLPVMHHGQLAGMLSRGHILRLLQTRQELHV